MTEPIDLGKEMWQQLSAAFHEVAELNGMSGHPAKAQFWAGYMAAASGAMCADLGPGDTRVILHAVTEACIDVVRGDLKVVKP